MNLISLRLFVLNLCDTMSIIDVTWMIEVTTWATIKQNRFEINIIWLWMDINKGKYNVKYYTGFSYVYCTNKGLY